MSMEHKVRSNPRCYSIWKQAEQSRSRMSMEHEVRECECGKD